MIPGTLVDLVPFEDDYTIYLQTWMNSEAWLRARWWERREPRAEHKVKQFIQELEKSENAQLVGLQAKNGDPIGGVAWEHQWVRMRRATLWLLVGDPRYEGTDELLDGLLMAVDYNFATRNLHRLETFALALDRARIALLQRAGFAHEGTLRRHVLWAGDYVDVLVFGILERGWAGYEATVEALGLQASGLPPKPKPPRPEAPTNRPKA